MGLRLCKCCCWTKRNKINHSNKTNLNVLLLGMENVGKTELGCILSGRIRTIYEPTNGVQCFQVELPNSSISITEIGGNKEMLKLWHHYYAKTMGLIFCYDMSGSVLEMQESFQYLKQITLHPCMRGKPVLLVGTKSDLVNDTVQLYDIENTFSLEALANRSLFSLKSVYFNPNELNNIWTGILWLVGILEINYKHLKGRINYDTIRENMEKRSESRKRKLGLSFRRRPRTAPATLSQKNVIPSDLLTSLKTVGMLQVAAKSVEQHVDLVPNTTNT